MRVWALAAAVALLSSPAGAQPEISIQEALLRAKPAVALVVAEVGAQVTVRCGAGDPTQVAAPPLRESGTGFFVSPSGWMITNARLVSMAHQPPAWMASQLTERAVRAACLPAILAERGLSPGEREDLEEQIVRELVAAAKPSAMTALERSISVILSNGARLSARVAKYTPPITGEGMSGRELALLAIEAADMPVLSLADSSETKIGDRVYIIGYPGVVMSHELLNASAKVEASVTTGAVSGFKQDRANQPVMQTDAAAEAGNRGGPTVNSAGDVVGVMTFATPSQGDGGSVQGFNFVIPSAAVAEFLRDSPARLGERSRFNAAWHTGLHLFFTGHYARATRPLDEANRLLPELPDVRRVTLENAERARAQGWLPWRTVGGVFVAVCVLGYAVLFARRRRRNRYRIAPAEVARLLDGPEPPTLLDVRDGATYAKSPVRLPRALHLPPEDLEAGKRPAEVATDRTVVAYCT